MKKPIKRMFRPRKSMKTFMERIQNEGRFLEFLNALLNTEDIVGESNDKRDFWNFLFRAISDPLLNSTQKLIENKINTVFNKQDASFVNETIYYSYATIMVKRPFYYLVFLLLLTLLFIFLVFNGQISSNLKYYIFFGLLLFDTILFLWWLKWHYSSFTKLLDTFNWLKTMMWTMTNLLATNTVDSLERLYAHRSKIELIKKDLEKNTAILKASKELIDLEYKINTDLLMLSSELAANEYSLKGEEFHNCINSASKAQQKFDNSAGIVLKNMINKINSDDLLSSRSKIVNHHVLSKSALIIRALESLSSNTNKYEKILRASIEDEEQRDNKTRELRAKHEYINKILSLFYTDSSEASKQVLLQGLMESLKFSDTRINISGDYYMLGDQINNSGNNNTLINRSSVINALNNTKDDSLVKCVEEALLELKKIVDSSNNEEAIKNHDAFCKHVSSDKPDKTILKSLWNSILAAIPTLAQSTTIITNIAKLFI
jgi:hypothetical protein